MFWMKVKAETEQAEREMVNRYSKALLHRRQKLGLINKWCEENLQMTFENVVCAKPNKLLEIRKTLDYIDTKLDTECSNYLINTLYNDLGNDRPAGNAKEILLSSLDVTVCPYCNRNYIFDVRELNKKYIYTCELDHFLPKSKYPLLAVSFYNLIPSCHFCNHTKGEEKLLAFYPYNISSKETNQIRFTYILLDTDYLTNKNSIVVEVNASDVIIKNSEEWPKWSRNNVENDINVLKLRQIYKKHNDVIQKILLKYDVFNPYYIKSIYKNYKEYFSSYNEVQNLFLDSPKSIQDTANVSLGKLKYDVISELNRSYRKRGL